MVWRDTSDFDGTAGYGSELTRQQAREARALARQSGNLASEASALLAELRSEFKRLPPKAVASPASQAALELACSLGKAKADASVAASAATAECLQDGSPSCVSTSQDQTLSHSISDKSFYVESLTNLFVGQFSLENPEEALRVARETLARLREIGADQSCLVDALLMELAARVELGEHGTEETLKMARQACSLSVSARSRRGVLCATNVLVKIFARRTPIGEASMVDVCKDAVEHFRASGDRAGQAAALKLKAAVCHALLGADKKDVINAANSEAVSAFQGLGDTEGEASVWQSAVYAHLARQQTADALIAAQEILSIYQGTGSVAKQASVLNAISHIHLLRENTNRALKINAEALDLARTGYDQKLLLDIHWTAAASHLIRRDMEKAEASARAISEINRKQSNPQGEAAALMLMVRAQLERGGDAREEAIKNGRQAVDILREAIDSRGQLAVMELVIHLLIQDRRFSEARPMAQEALTLAKELSMQFSEANALFLIGKCDMRSPPGAKSLQQAHKMFKDAGYWKAAGTAAHALANSCLVQSVPDVAQAHKGAEAGLAAFRQAKDTKGEAIMLHTMANCMVAAGMNQQAVATTYDAARLFQSCGDDYGKGLAVKMLQALGQTEDQIQEGTKKTQVVSFDAVETKESMDDEEKRRREEEKRQEEEELKLIMEEPVLWEYAWVPSETQDPVKFGEKRSGGGARKIFFASEMQDSGILRQLAECHATANRTKPGFFGNKINGRLLTNVSMQAAMEASQCAAVIYDCSMLNHLTQLEVMDVALRLVQALQPIEEPQRVAMDTLLCSTQYLAHTSGIREPFHSTLWGFFRAARLENPLHEFRVTDLDSSRRMEDMAFVSRYLMGAQAVRPVEALVRKGGLQVSRLVSARCQLKAPMKVGLTTE